jgi:hypothetical protein
VIRLTLPAHWASSHVRRLFSDGGRDGVHLRTSWLRHADGLLELLALPEGVSPTAEAGRHLTLHVRPALNGEASAPQRLRPGTGIVSVWPDGSWQGQVRFEGAFGMSLPEAAIDELWLPGPGLHLLACNGSVTRLSAARSGGCDWQGGSASGWLLAAGAGRDPSGRFSRQAGSLGWGAIESLRRMRLALVGCGRNGHALAMVLATYSPREIVLIDPDHVEPGNEDAGIAYCAHEPEPQGLTSAHKVDRLQALLSKRLPVTHVAAVPYGIADPRAARAAANCEVIISATDSDAARFACAAIAQCFLRVHLDVGSLVTQSHAGVIELGADIRLTIPGDRDLCCLGGLASQADVSRLAGGLAPAAARDWRDHKAGASTSWSTVVAGVAIRMLEDLAAERLRQSHWVRLLQSETDRAPRSLDLGAPADPYCPLCAVAGHGNAWARRLRDLAAAALIRAQNGPAGAAANQGQSH